MRVPWLDTSRHLSATITERHGAEARPQYSTNQNEKAPIDRFLLLDAEDPEKSLNP